MPSGALAHVDSSSGAIGTAVNRSIDALAPTAALLRRKLDELSKSLAP
jgi:hypothetical protein